LETNKKTKRFQMVTAYLPSSSILYLYENKKLITVAKIPCDCCLGQFWRNV